MVIVYLKDETLLDIAGVLVIISSCFALLTSLSNLISYMSYYAPRPHTDEPLFFRLVLINVFGFPLGITGGILALLRKRFILTTSGMGILLSAHVLSVILPLIKYSPYSPYFPGIYLWNACPVIVISALGLIITIKKRESFS